MTLRSQLRKFERDFSGRKITEKERGLLERAIPDSCDLNWLFEILKEHRISGSMFILSEEDDLSGLGVEMIWLLPDQLVSEAVEAYPGIAAISKCYVPIGACLLGSGDPYFIRCLSDKDSPIVRIPHDIVLPSGSINVNEVQLVSNNLENFLELAKIE